MATVTLEEVLERLDTKQQERVAALVAARMLLTMAVPAPQVKAAEFPHELTGIASYVLTGEDVFNEARTVE